MSSNTSSFQTRNWSSILHRNQQISTYLLMLCNLHIVCKTYLNEQRNLKQVKTEKNNRVKCIERVLLKIFFILCITPHLTLDVNATDESKNFNAANMIDFMLVLKTKESRWWRSGLERSPHKRKVRCSNPSRDRAKSLKRVRNRCETIGHYA